MRVAKGSVMTRRSQHGSGQEGVRKDRRSGATERARCLQSETSERRCARGAEAQLRRHLGGVGAGKCATACPGGSALPLLGGYQEWGVSGSVRIDPGASGTCRSLTVAPTSARNRTAWNGCGPSGSTWPCAGRVPSGVGPGLSDPSLLRRKGDVDPDQAVVGGIDQRGPRGTFHRPEDSRRCDIQAH